MEKETSRDSQQRGSVEDDMVGSPDFTGEETGVREMGWCIHFLTPWMEQGRDSVISSLLFDLVLVRM